MMPLTRKNESEPRLSSRGGESAERMQQNEMANGADAYTVVSTDSTTTAYASRVHEHLPTVEGREAPAARSQIPSKLVIPSPAAAMSNTTSGAPDLLHRETSSLTNSTTSNGISSGSAGTIPHPTPTNAASSSCHEGAPKRVEKKKDAADTATATRTNKQSTTKKDRSHLRKGKWTREEEEYTTRLIHSFRNGLLKLPEGATLRSFLAEKLNCDPMRITKKFAGASLLGRRVYQFGSNKAQSSQNDIDRAKNELAELEQRFHLREKHGNNGIPLHSLAQLVPLMNTDTTTPTFAPTTSDFLSSGSSTTSYNGASAPDSSFGDGAQNKPYSQQQHLRPQQAPTVGIDSPQAGICATWLSQAMSTATPVAAAVSGANRTSLPLAMMMPLPSQAYQWNNPIAAAPQMGVGVPPWMTMNNQASSSTQQLQSSVMSPVAHPPTPSPWNVVQDGSRNDAAATLGNMPAEWISQVAQLGISMASAPAAAASSSSSVDEQNDGAAAASLQWTQIAQFTQALSQMASAKAAACHRPVTSASAHGTGNEQPRPPEAMPIPMLPTMSGFVAPPQYPGNMPAAAASPTITDAACTQFLQHQQQSIEQPPPQGRQQQKPEHPSKEQEAKQKQQQQQKRAYDERLRRQQDLLEEQYRRAASTRAAAARVAAVSSSEGNGSSRETSTVPVSEEPATSAKIAQDEPAQAPATVAPSAQASPREQDPPLGSDSPSSSSIVRSKEDQDAGSMLYKFLSTLRESHALAMGTVQRKGEDEARGAGTGTTSHQREHSSSLPRNGEVNEAKVRDLSPFQGNASLSDGMTHDSQVTAISKRHYAHAHVPSYARDGSEAGRTDRSLGSTAPRYDSTNSLGGLSLSNDDNSEGMVKRGGLARDLLSECGRTDQSGSASSSTEDYGNKTDGDSGSGASSSSEDDSDKCFQNRGSNNLLSTKHSTNVVGKFTSRNVADHTIRSMEIGINRKAASQGPKINAKSLKRKRETCASTTKQLPPQRRHYLDGAVVCSKWQQQRSSINTYTMTGKMQK